MGEKQGFREGMDRMTRQLVENGMPAKQAEEKARKHANRVHNLKDGRGNPHPQKRD